MAFVVNDVRLDLDSSIPERIPSFRPASRYQHEDVIQRYDRVASRSWNSARACRKEEYSAEEVFHVVDLRWR